MLSTMKPRAAWWEEGGEYVVQNVVGPYLGQEHRHTLEDFLRWCAEAEREGWEITPAWQDERDAK